MESVFEAFLALSDTSGSRGEIQQAQPLPAPRCEVRVREATVEDMPFLDALQKMHSHMVGFFPKKQMEKYVSDGHVLVAEGGNSPSPSGRGRGGGSSDSNVDACGAAENPTHPPTPSLKGGGDVPAPLGYVIARDQYMKRDDVGIIYQLNVVPMQQRHLVGATLLQEVFERAAYGCKLFSCWCAQDIQANYFWESVGFVPLAFRTGSRAKQRIHIFWQKRIREGDEGPGATEYWYPSQTQNGAVSEDRLVLPIPPGTHWRDAKPLVLPGFEVREEFEVPQTLPGGAAVKPRPEETIAHEKDKEKEKKPSHQVALVESASKDVSGLPVGKVAVMTPSGVKYVDKPGYVPPVEEEKPKKPKRKVQRKKHDPKQIAAARELRDRYLDAVNSGRLLPSPTEAKYALQRQLEGAGGGVDPRTGARVSQVAEDRLLDAA